MFCMCFPCIKLGEVSPAAAGAFLVFAKRRSYDFMTYTKLGEVFPAAAFAFSFQQKRRSQEIHDTGVCGNPTAAT